MVLVITLVQLEGSVALVGSLDGIALGLDSLHILLAGDGSQLGQNLVGLDLTINQKAALLQEAVGEALDLGISVFEAATTEGQGLLLGDAFLLGAKGSVGVGDSLLLIGEVQVLEDIKLF